MKKVFLFLPALMVLGGLFMPSSLRAAEIQKKDLCGGANLSFSDEAAGCNKIYDPETGQFRETREGEGAESRVNQLIRQIIQIISVVVGIVAVIMIIWGGFKFITSGGDAGRVTSAKQTILYGLVGLVIVALAQVIVRFVLSKSTQIAD